ncbi:protein of unknown function [Legionella fallonii LLAP-10]|uniref:Uncharacterized protein n=1 Tax=Legionella fallonii LLAP-10 TaxID=1212491 RepID=A0A098G710_9GAMM|nr:protein of unknown function [Legionella fallonii LLAP-10]
MHNQWILLKGKSRGYARGNQARRMKYSASYTILKVVVP